MTSIVTQYLLQHKLVCVGDEWVLMSGDWELDLTVAARHALAQINLPWRGLADTANFIAEGIAESDLEYDMSPSSMAEHIREKAIQMKLR